MDIIEKETQKSLAMVSVKSTTGISGKEMSVGKYVNNTKDSTLLPRIEKYDNIIQHVTSHNLC
jgi:hypothetical protein